MARRLKRFVLGLVGLVASTASALAASHIHKIPVLEFETRAKP
jgi:hypothetical protein